MKDERAVVKSVCLRRPFIFHPSSLILSLLCLLAGCAHYEYEVVQPPELAGHVGDDAWVALRRGGGIDYRLRSYDNYLVMLVYNDGDTPVKLLGTDSFAVDPHGESHPMPSSTIPPGSYVKRIFPPPRPRVDPYGPSWSFGVGYVHAQHVSAATSHPPHHSAWYPYPYHYGYANHYYEPRYYTVYDVNDRTYFNWPGGTSVRFLFAFAREGQEGVIRQELLVRRVKM
jgi:hypothetical protein